MEKLKEFMSSPKKTAILGLIGSILMMVEILEVISNIFVYHVINVPSLLMNLLFRIFGIGSIIYFVIILMRFKNKNININIANCILIVTSILNTIIIIPRGLIISAILQIIISLYFINLLFNANIPINNKVFVIIAIVNVVIGFYTNIQYVSYINEYITLIKISLTYVGYLCIIPYFYNYYNLLKKGGK